MKHLNSLLRFLLLFAGLPWSSALAQSAGGTHGALLDRAQSALSGGSAAFIQNRGQWNPEARFLARFNGLDLWVTDNGVVYDLYHADNRPPASPTLTDMTRSQDDSRVGHVVRMNFVGAKSPSVEGVEMLPGTFNYFVGNDRSKWATGVPRYAQARIKHLYDGIDAAIYFDKGQPRYDILLGPGANPADIRLSYGGATRLSVSRNGELIIGTSVGDVRQAGLFAYQMVDGRQKQIRCAFKALSGNRVGFTLGAYDPAKPLVIDPLLVGTYISGSSGYSRGSDIALDGDRNIYVGGYTGYVNYPTTQGAYQTTYAGNLDGVLTKLDSSGKTLKYSTFFGGSIDDVVTAIAVDGNGIVYLTGYTSSVDFPVVNAYDATQNNQRDVFVMKFDPAGATPATQLLYSTYVGGGSLDFAMGLTVKNGSAYVAGFTFSNNFPTVAPFQTFQGQSDAFVFRLSPAGNALVASTYLGGGLNNDVGYDVGIDNTGNVYVAGSTRSTNFPTAGTNPAYDATANGAADVFLTKLTPSLDAIVYSTFMGGTGTDEAYGLAVDGTGNAYLTGMAALGFPATTDSWDEEYNGGDNDIFMAKFSPTGALLYSTFIGGNNDEYGYDVTFDAAGNAYSTGVTRAQNFPVTSNALQATLKGTTDFDCFVAEVSPNGGSLLYATYLGGNAGDTGNAITLDQYGYIYTTGTTFSSNFPTTAGTYQQSGVGGMFVSKIGIMKMTEPSGGEVWCAGDVIPISWRGAAADGAFDLYISPDSGRTFSPIAFNVTGTSYQWAIPSSLPPSSDYRIRVIISNGVEADMSQRLTINSPPSVQAQPADITIGAGGTATFVSTATGTPEPTIRWQKKVGNTWTDIAGQTSSSLRVLNVTTAMNGTFYRALFTNACRTIVSDSAMLTVPSINVSSPNGGESYCAGTTQTITWETAETGPVNILLSSDGGANFTPLTSNVSGKSYSWNIPANLSGSRFRIQITVNGQTQDVSNANFTINTAPKVTKDPASTSALTGNNASFAVEGNGSPAPAIIWEVNTGGDWTAVDGATAATLTLHGLTLDQNGARYRAILSNDCGRDTSAEAVLTVSIEPGSVDEGAGAERAFRLALLPNPVGATATICYRLPRPGRAELRVVDMAGRVVARPLDAQMRSGDHEIAFDASALPPGAYTCVLLFGGTQSTVKMRVVR